ncbi:MAG: hypothetical protein ACYTGG_02440 [Planctomycetota bacterium]|jgi:hypothetical protein
MHCKNCDYPLWNLKARQCPECGSPFRPSDFEFVINSVQFCCPGCEQVYYGTGPSGHLLPPEFSCVSCGQPVVMDAMVLRPAAGIEEHRTRAAANPWLHRRDRGFFKSWLATIGRALVGPYRLMKETPVQSSTGEAWWFALATALGTWLAAVVPVMCFMIIPIASLPQGSGGPGVGALAAGMGMGLGLMLLFAMGGTIALIGVNGLVAHGLLRITGGAAHGLGRTYQAMCYGSGANAISAIPCFGGYVGWIWWMVSSVLMLREAQRVHGGRAAFAVLTLPIAVGGSFIALYVWVIVQVMTGAIGSGPGMGITTSVETQTVAQGITDYAARNNGQGPRHGVEMVASGDLGAIDFVAVSTQTLEVDVPVGDTDLEQVSLLPVNRQRLAIQAAADALPPDVIAHRVGDFVLTHHGMNLSNPDGRLWLVVLWPDPDLNAPPNSIVVGRADGTTRLHGVPLTQALSQQNQVRSENGLPPLPDPATVTHGRPARGSP